MSLDQKMEDLLEAYPGFGKNRESEAPAQGSSQKSSHEVLEKGSGGGKTIAKSNAGIAPLGPKVGAFEAKPAHQGDSKDSPVEDLGKDEPGNVAFRKAKGKAGLTARGAGQAPGFKTVSDPTSVVTQKTSKGNVHQEETEAEDSLSLVDALLEMGVELTEEQIAALEARQSDSEEDALEEVVEDTSAKCEEVNVRLREELANDVNNLFEGEVDLTEEFKAKAVSLFEAAVTARVANEMEKVEDAIAEKAVEMIAENELALTEKLDAYLSYVAEEWVSENELAVGNMLRTQITENFMESLRVAFAENYIDIPDEKLDVLGQMQEAIEVLESERDEIIEDANALANELIALKRDAIIFTVTEGLAKTQVEKFETLVEDVTYEDDESFAEKLGIVKKNLFGGSTSGVTSFVDEEAPTTISEGKDSEVERIAAMITGTTRF